MDYDFIIDLIDGGELDDKLDILIDAAVTRRNYLRDMRGAMNKATLSTGTRVRLVNIRPKYMIGIQGTISNKSPQRRGDMMVDIDPMYRSRIGHRYSMCLSIPASSLEEVK